MAQFKVKGIMSFPHVFEARAIEDGAEKKYSCGLLIADNDPQLQTLLTMQQTELQNTFPSGAPANVKKFIEPSSDYPGYHFLKTSAKESHQPHIVDANAQPIMDRSAVYAGAEAWLVINTFGYSMTVNKGVSAGLNGVLVTGNEGPLGRLDSRPSVEQMFGDITGGNTPAAAPAAPAPAAAAPAAPAPAAAAPAAPVGLVMTAAANGVTYDAYKAAGWTDDAMIANGLAIAPSFG